jgi:Fe-S-cluster containining protein
MEKNLCLINNCHECCVDTRLKLNLKEAATLRNLGTVLLALHHFDGRRNVPRGRDGEAYYDMEGSCGALDSNGLCSIHEDPKRPKVCRTFIAGSEECLKIREERGLGPLKK